MKIKSPPPPSRGAHASPGGKTSKTGKAFSLEPREGATGSSAPGPSASDARAPGRTGSAGPTMPQALQDLEQQRKRIDKLLAQAAGGRSFSPQQLLKLQATVYRYGQDLEVLSRVVDKTVGALKQTLNTQV